MKMADVTQTVILPQKKKKEKSFYRKKSKVKVTMQCALIGGILCFKTFLGNKL